jgi:hypothetical protein
MRLHHQALAARQGPGHCAPSSSGRSLLSFVTSSHAATQVHPQWLARLARQMTDGLSGGRVGKTAASPPAPALPPGEGAPTARHRHDAHGRGRLVVGLRYIYAATRRRSVGRQRSVTTSPPVHCHHRRQQPLGIAAAFSWRLSQGTEVRPVRACVRACVQRAVGEWGSVLGPEASWRTSER